MATITRNTFPMEPRDPFSRDPRGQRDQIPQVQPLSRDPSNPFLARVRSIVTVLRPTEAQLIPNDVFLTAILIDPGTLSQQEITNTRIIRTVTPSHTVPRPVGTWTYRVMPTAQEVPRIAL